MKKLLEKKKKETGSCTFESNTPFPSEPLEAPLVRPETVTPPSLAKSQALWNRPAFFAGT